MIDSRLSDTGRLSLPEIVPFVRCPTCGTLCDPVYSRADRVHFHECAQEAAMEAAR